MSEITRTIKFEKVLLYSSTTLMTIEKVVDSHYVVDENGTESIVLVIERKVQ